MSTTISDSSTLIVSKEAIAEDFMAAMDGKLEEEKLHATVETLLATKNAYPANGSIASFIFYLQFQITITSPGGKTFNGKAGGFTSAGGGALFGTVFTDDLSKLFKETHAFQFQAAPGYIAIIFFDGHNRCLGHFQAAAVSTVIGIGGGTEVGLNLNLIIALGRCVCGPAKKQSPHAPQRLRWPGTNNELQSAGKEDAIEPTVNALCCVDRLCVLFGASNNCASA